MKTAETSTREMLASLKGRLESELRLADELGLASVAIDLNQAIEKLRAALEEK